MPPVQMLIDTGSSITMVCANNTAETVPVLCVHGDTEKYPTAESVAPNLIVPVLLGRDVYDVQTTEMGLMAETRAQRRHKEQEEQAVSTLAVEPEAEPSTPFDIPGEPGDTPEQQESISTPAVERDEQPRREEGVEIPVEDNTLTDLPPLQATKEELLKWQKQDPTLARVRKLVPNEQEQMNMERVYFYQKDGLIYRHWHPRQATADSVRSCEQLVLPEKCRALVLRIAHDVPTRGHLGITKTKDRILQRYYWPGVFQDITEYCKTCEVCQRSRGRRPAQAPMLPMPLIQKPFTRIAMDLIGPLPKTKPVITLPDILRLSHSPALKHRRLRRN